MNSDFVSKNTDKIIAKEPERECDGYISKIILGNKVYKLRCEVVEVHPMTCPKCGGHVELKYGQGKCNYCDTNFTTQFKIVESN